MHPRLSEPRLSEGPIPITENSQIYFPNADFLKPYLSGLSSPCFMLHQVLFNWEEAGGVRQKKGKPINTRRRWSLFIQQQAKNFLLPLFRTHATWYGAFGQAYLLHSHFATQISILSYPNYRLFLMFGSAFEFTPFGWIEDILYKWNTKLKSKFVH